MPVCEILEKELGYSVVIENNVNAFAIAELMYGFGRKYDNLLVIKWGPGVGSTIIIDNKVYEGRHAKAAQKPFSQNAFGEAYRMAKTQGDAQVFDEAIDLFARTIVNSITILAPNRVVLCGRLFQDEEIRERLIEQCKQYDAGCDEKRIIYSVLAEKEDYIGPVAAFVQEEIF